MHYPDLRYDCLQCAKGCRTTFDVVVNEAAEVSINQSQSGQKAVKEGYQPVRVIAGDRKIMARRPNGQCVLLNSDNLCSVHAELGIQAKPRTCRQFPFHPINTPDGIYVGLSFFCSAVQRGHGRPMGEQAAEIEATVSEYFLEEKPETISAVSLPVGPDVFVDWSTYLEIERTVVEQVRTRPLKEALWRATAQIGRAFLHAHDTPAPFQVEGMRATAAPDWGVAEPALESLAGALISIVEVPDSAEDRAAVANAYSSGTLFHSARTGSPLQNVSQAAVPEWFDDEVATYLEHVIFRKFLTHGPILGRAFVLGALYQVLKFYTLNHAGARQRGTEKEDYYQALDTVELELMLHADGLSPLYDHMQFIALQILDS